MAKKQKKKKNNFKLRLVLEEQNNNTINDEIDESVAHQISLVEILEQKKMEETLKFEEDEDEQIKISPCIILSSANSDIKVNGGFDFSGVSDRIALFSQKRRKRATSTNKNRTSLTPQAISGGSNNNNNNNKNSNNKNNNKNTNTNRNNSTNKNSSKAKATSKSKSSVVKSNVIYLKDKIQKAQALKNMPANYLIICIAVLLILIAIIWGATNKNANEVFVGEKSVGIIKEKDITQEKLFNDAIAKLKTEKGVNVAVNEKITLKPVHASKKEVANIDYVLTEICKNFTYQVEAVAIVVDGKEIALAESKAVADKILDDIAAKYVTEGAVIKERSFTQDVKIENKFVNNNQIETNETIIAKLTATTTQPKVHTVVSGDTLSSIARQADMSLADLYKANPDLNENSVLQLEQSINLVVPVPVLSIKTVEQVTYEEEFDAEPIIVENNQEYKTYEKVISEGKPGKRTVSAEITKVNGYEESRENVEENVTVEPVAKKIERGTLQTPPKKAVGNFIYPVSGRLSSGYGARWGRSHKGIDLACSRGTPIYASDGGTVEFSGWNTGGYGYLVIIDHGNGYSTYYGHNSKNVVSAGEKVYQGQLIGYVGSTGDSTGNHVHFEIRKNGSAKNPMSYLN